MKSNIEEIAKSREILFIFDSRDSNPNGERDPHIQGPRIDPKTGYAIVSDLRIKRTIRDYLIKNGYGNDNKVMSRRSLAYDNRTEISEKDRIIKDFNTSENELKRKNDQELYDLIADTYIDHRLFGSLTKISNDLHGTTGPVQFEVSFSLNIPRVICLPITASLSSESSKSAGAMGKSYFLDYAIFPVHGILKNSLAKISKATEIDVNKLFRGLWDGTKSLNTRSKFGQMPRLLISLIMKKPGYQLSGIKHVFSGSSVKENCSTIEDIDIKLDRLGEYIEQYKEKIEAIEYKEDISLNLHFQDKVLNSISDLAKYISNCPQFISIL